MSLRRFAVLAIRRMRTPCRLPGAFLSFLSWVGSSPIVQSRCNVSFQPFFTWQIPRALLYRAVRSPWRISSDYEPTIGAGGSISPRFSSNGATLGRNLSRPNGSSLWSRLVSIAFNNSDTQWDTSTADTCSMRWTTARTAMENCRPFLQLRTRAPIQPSSTPCKWKCEETQA